jgi:hypothetical protein
MNLPLAEYAPSLNPMSACSSIGCAAARREIQRLAPLEKRNGKCSGWRRWK